MEARPLVKPLNSSAIDYCPYLDLEGGVLYFTSQRSEISGSMPKAMDLPGLLKLFSQAENGSGRIYRVEFSKITDLLGTADH